MILGVMQVVGTAVAVLAGGTCYAVLLQYEAWSSCTAGMFGEPWSQ